MKLQFTMIEMLIVALVRACVLVCLVFVFDFVIFLRLSFIKNQLNFIGSMRGENSKRDRALAILCVRFSLSSELTNSIRVIILIILFTNYLMSRWCMHFLLLLRWDTERKRGREFFLIACRVYVQNYTMSVYAQAANDPEV